MRSGSIQFDVALGFSLQTSARLDAVEIAVDVDLQQDRRVITRSACISRNSAIKPQIYQVEFVDKYVDYANRIGITDVVVKAFGKQGTLSAMVTLDEAFLR